MRTNFSGQGVLERKLGELTTHLVRTTVKPILGGKDSTSQFVCVKKVVTYLLSGASESW